MFYCEVWIDSISYNNKFIDNQHSLDQLRLIEQLCNLDNEDDIEALTQIYNALDTNLQLLLLEKSNNEPDSKLSKWLKTYKTKSYRRIWILQSYRTCNNWR